MCSVYSSVFCDEAIKPSQNMFVTDIVIENCTYFGVKNQRRSLKVVQRVRDIILLSILMGPEACPLSLHIHLIYRARNLRAALARHPHITSTPTGKEDRTLKKYMFAALKKAEETKKKELVAVRNEYDSKIKVLQYKLTESQKKCKQLEMQVVAQSREVSADERKLCSSRQAAQMHKTTMAGRKTVDPTCIPTSSVKPTKESSTQCTCTPTVANEDQMERFKIGMVHDFRDKTVAKVRAEVLKEKENDIKKVKEDMSREIERIYSAAQEEKGVAVEEAVAQVLKEKEKEISRVKDELRRCKEELDRVKTERVKEMEEMRARLPMQNESMDSLKAGLLKAKKADKAKTELRREHGEQMQKQKDKEMDELRATLLKKEQEFDKVRDELIAEHQQQMEQLKLNMMKEKRKEMDVLRTELLREKEREIHEAKAEMTQKTAREIEQLKIEVMKEKGKEQWKGREGEISKLKPEMAMEKEREVKIMMTKVVEESQKEMERMRTMLLRDKEEEISNLKARMNTQMEREMEFRTEAMKKKEIELDKLRDILKEKDDKLKAVISERKREIEALKFELLKEKEKKSEKTNAGANVCGLSNLGNTCYMNAALQCVYGTAAFKDAFMKGPVNGELATELRNFLQEMSIKKAVKPLQLKLLIQNSFRGFSGSSQQDSQEFLTALLERLHEELRTDGTTSTEESLVSRVFHGQLQTTLHCETCHQATIKCDPFMFLSVSIPIDFSQAQQGKRTSKSIELTDCLNTFSKEEFFGDNCWFCTKCNKHANMRRKAAVFIPPQVLIVYLKRFRQDSHGIRHKITATVQFPSNLDLTPFMTSKQTTNYNLFAVINHAGIISSGHSLGAEVQATPSFDRLVELPLCLVKCILEFELVEMSDMLPDTPDMKSSRKGQISAGIAPGCPQGSNHRYHSLVGRVRMDGIDHHV
ncbi:hypothetical protein EMCRGX_G030452 [Ephydatia muelleri]